MYLELAESEFDYLSQNQNNDSYFPEYLGDYFPEYLGQDENVDVTELYIYIPAHISPTGEAMYINEEEFDFLPEKNWNKVMDALSPYQQQNLGFLGFGKKARKRRQERREKRRKAKLQKIQARGEARATARAAGQGPLGGLISSISRMVGGGGGGDIDYPEDPDPDPDDIKPWWKEPLIMVPLGIGGATILYFLLKPKKKK